MKAQVGGKIAQLGARLIDATAKQMADQFFDRFSAEVSGPAEIAADGPAGLAALVTTPPGPQAPVAVNLLSMIPKEPIRLPAGVLDRQRAVPGHLHHDLRKLRLLSLATGPALPATVDATAALLEGAGLHR